MIKAIETRYKGYRFRSRLEARWAVYFDALELEWEYEPEGFDLGNGEYYLPDFRINCGHGKFYFEVKAKDGFSPKAKRKKAYLAGKISHDQNWRREIANERFIGQKYEFYSIDPDSRMFSPGFYYSGPNFSDNHGCVVAHQRARHQIEKSDFLFAWVNSKDAYGTFHEIGFADAIGKKIYIGYSPEMPKDDMWFMSKSAEAFGVFDCASDAWESMIPSVTASCQEERKVCEFSIYKPIVLLMGDPLDDQAYFYNGGGYIDADIDLILNSALEDHIKSAKKARSARFEHGESP